MPKGFAFPTNEELWLPLYSEFPPKPRNDPANINPSVIGLLKPGVSLDQATAEFTALAKRFAAAYPETNKQFNTGQVEPLIKTFTPRPLRGTLLTMLGFCVGVLLIACVNVMNMQFARATLRAKELAIRSSLGATRIRLIRQMLTESLLVAGDRRVVGIGARLCVDRLAAGDGPQSREPAAGLDHFDVDGDRARGHRRRDDRRGGRCPACCRPGCRRAPTPTPCSATADAATPAAASRSCRADWSSSRSSSPASC